MIRDAKPQDAAAICAIWNPVIEATTITFTTTPKSDAMIQEMIKTRPVLIAEQDGQVAGFASFAQFRDGPGYANTFEHTIMLDPAFHGSGLGGKLLDAIKARAKAMGGHMLIGGASGENARAIAFHKRHGFEEVARLPEVGRKFDRWLDLVLMQFPLR